MKVNEIKSWIPEMERLKVSEVARSPRGFLTYYLENDGKLNEYWSSKRNSFISRTFAAFKKKPTYRRALALIAWAFMPATIKTLKDLKLIHTIKTGKL
jgi:hypothetical protein